MRVIIRRKNFKVETNAELTQMLALSDKHTEIVIIILFYIVLFYNIYYNSKC